MTTTNAVRRARALAALEGHAMHAGEDGRDTDRARLIDLVTDLRHLADAWQVDFDQVVELSAIHHTEERA